jgi:LL-diaminopimelate aminotransferase
MFSWSKAYNMTGWRVGAAVGNADTIAALLKLKTNVDSGQFDAIQLAAARILGPEGDEHVARMREIYRRRRDLVIEALAAAGIEVAPPRGTLYVWVPVPGGHTSVSFAELILEQAGVVVSPGSAYGPNGEGYVRLSLTVSDERLREAMARIEQHLRVPA